MYIDLYTQVVLMAEAAEEDLLASFSNLRALVGKDLLDEAQEIARIPPKATTGDSWDSLRAKKSGVLRNGLTYYILKSLEQSISQREMNKYIL